LNAAEGLIIIETTAVAEEGQLPSVVNVTVYVFTPLALTSIKPVRVSRKIKPEGDDVNTPVLPPVMLAKGSEPAWHKMAGE